MLDLVRQVQYLQGRLSEGSQNFGTQAKSAIHRLHLFFLFFSFFFFSFQGSLSYALQISSVQSRPTLCNPMNHSMPGLPLYHLLPESTQTHAHWVRDAIQPSHPLSSPSPPVPTPSQHHGLFQWVNSSNEVAKVLELQLQHQSFQWIPRTDLL